MTMPTIFRQWRAAILCVLMLIAGGIFTAVADAQCVNRQCPAQRPAAVQRIKPGEHVQHRRMGRVHRVHRERHRWPFQRWVRGRGFKRALWGG